MVDVEHLTVVGGGVMGSGVGQAFLQNGYSVTIRDIDQEILDEARERIESGNFGLDRAVEGGYLDADEKEAALDRLTLTTDLGAAVADADVVLEAVPEDLALKGRVFRELDDTVDEGVPLFSNTSGFPIAALGNAVKDPSRVIGTHFFNPAQIMDLVEVVTTPQTDESVAELVRSLAADLGKTPVFVEDEPTEYGYIVNRLWGAMQEEARKVVREGIATEEEVNLAMREGRNLPSGPLEGAGLGEEWG